MYTIQSRGFTGRTDVEAETPILWPPDAKSWFIWKDLNAGKDWGQEEKGMTEDEMVGWHHWFNGHGFGWTLGVGDGQGGLVCCGSWGCKESDTTEWLNWTETCKKTSPSQTGVAGLPWTWWNATWTAWRCCTSILICLLNWSIRRLISPLLG